jgi:hypothetical protein
MKVTIAYQCELEDIPTTVYELLGNIKENDLPHLEINLNDAVLYINDGNFIETLAAMDEARIRLAKIDQKLLDYASILGGYVKADTNIKLGITPEEALPTSAIPQGTQEISAQDILAVEGEEVTND